MTIYITSDTHFGHHNICGPDGFVPTRKHFEHTAAMDEALVAIHNEIVGTHDTVYHLGDIAMNKKPKQILETLESLNGHFFIIKGNHDPSRTLQYLKNHNYALSDGLPKFVGFEDVGVRIKQDKCTYYLSHFPMGLGENRKKMRNLCGHIHEIAAREANILNVGVDSPEIGSRPFGQPLLLDEAIALVDAKWNGWFESMQRQLNS